MSSHPIPQSPSLASLLDTLDQFLRDLQDEGVRTLPCTGPLPPVAEENDPPTRGAAAESARVPRHQTAPPAESSSVSAVRPADGLVSLLLERLPECLGPHTPEETRVLLVLDAHELAEPEYRKLLQTMLHAIGYPLPEPPQPVTALADCTDKACRILCLGEKANELFCTVNMGLNLVRGKWQTTPAGRMIATHAPSYLLNNPAGKRAAWSDLQKLLEDLGLTVPEWTRKKLGQ